jgi:hypothetical protein
MRARLQGANAALLRALRQQLCAATAPADPPECPAFTILAFEEEPWASLTFRGARHWVELRLAGRAQAVEALAARLRDWPSHADTLLPGHFLAELQIVETARESRPCGWTALGLRLEALTVEE